MLPIGRWKGYGGETDYQGATLETITWAGGIAGRNQTPHRFGTVHAPLFHPVVAAKAMVTADQIGDGPLRTQPRLRLERGRVPHVRRRSARSRGALRLRAGMARRGQGACGRATTSSTSTARTSTSKEVRAKPKPFGGTRPLHHECRRLADRPGFRHAQLRRASSSRPRCSARHRGAERRPRSKPRRASKAASIDVLPPASSPAGRRARKPRTTTITPWSRMPISAPSTTSSRCAASRQTNIRRTNSPRCGASRPMAWAACASSGRPTTSPTPSRRCAAGLDGIGFSFIHYIDELPYFCAEVLPRLERLGLRSKARAVVAALGCGRTCRTGARPRRR